MIEFIREFWAFMRVRKKFWLLPLLTVMILLGILMVLTEGSAVAPFIYAIFEPDVTSRAHPRPIGFLPR